MTSLYAKNGITHGKVFRAFKEKLDVNVPLNRQEVLFMESNILYKREKLASDEYLQNVKRGVVLYNAELPLEKGICGCSR